MEEIFDKIIGHVDKRIDQLERLVTLSLMADILSEYTDGLCDELSEEIKEFLGKNGFHINKAEAFSDKIAVYIRTNRKVGIKELREIKKLVELQGPNLILVFELEKVTAVQRRKFVEEKISYKVKESEIFISK